MERKALDQNNERKPWFNANYGRKEKPWLVSKRDMPSSPVPPASKRDYPPSKRVNTGKAPMSQEDESQEDQFTLVKGVPDWFLKKVKPELFQGYKHQSKIGSKMVRPPNAPTGQWVVVRDPKTKTPQMIPMLTRTQKRKLQRRYTSFQMEEYASKNNSTEGERFNPRFNRLRREDSEESLRKGLTQSEAEALESLAARMDGEVPQNSPVSPHSLASYQSGLLEAMIVEQEEGEGANSSPIEVGSPMETSVMENPEVNLSGEASELPVQNKRTIQFGTLPEVHINMVSPSFDFGPFGPECSPVRRALQPTVAPMEVIDVSSDDEYELTYDNGWNEGWGTLISKIQKEEEEEELMIMVNAMEEPEVTSKERAIFVPETEMNTEYPLIVDLNCAEISYPFKSPSTDMRHHLKPLYISALFDGISLNRVLVDNGAAVNILPSRTLKKLGKEKVRLIPTSTSIAGFTGESKNPKGIVSIRLKVGQVETDTAFFVVDTFTSKYNALLGRDWIHVNGCIPSSMHQALMIVKYENGKGVGVEEIKADPHPFSTSANCAEAEMYKPEIIPLSEIAQPATPPSSVLEIGELAELKSKLKQAVDYESDNSPDEAAWM